jgi:hypothetical protein
VADVADVSDALKKIIEGKIQPLEDRLKVTPGFFEDLLNQGNDWSFIIKIHSLVHCQLNY